MDKKVVEEIIKQLNNKFGQETQLSTNRIKVLSYLGMTINIEKKEKYVQLHQKNSW